MFNLHIELANYQRIGNPTNTGRGGSTGGAEGAPAPLLPKTPWKIEVRRRERKRKERREEEERGGWRKKKGDEPPQRANPGSATGCIT